MTNDNPDKVDIERAIKDARVRAGRAKMRGDSGDEEFNTRKLEAIKKLKTLKEDWKRAALMGAAATAAGAGTAAAIGFPVVAGAVLAGGQYALSKNGLRKDWRRKRTLSEKNWEKWWLKKAIKKATKGHIAKAEARKKFKEKYKD